MRHPVGGLVQLPVGHPAAARTPDAVALVCGGRRMTYRELDEAANRVAHLLRVRGADRENSSATVCPGPAPRTRSRCATRLAAAG
ncbi:hypothetical protein MAHJHV55_55040 [Mycobacterium avium subsp. hominissuis]